MDEVSYPKRMKIRWRWDGEQGDYVTYQNPATGSISVLNPVGAAIFALSDGEHTLAEIVDHIVHEFDADDRDRVKEDVVRFLTFLSDIGAVRLLRG